MTKKESLSTLFKTIDLYKAQYLLHLKGKSKQGTIWGSFISLGVILGILIIILGIIRNQYSNPWPLQVTQDFQYNNPQPIQLKQQNFMFAVGFNIAAYQQYFTNPAYNVTAYFMVTQTLPSLVDVNVPTQIPLIPCTFSMFKRGDDAIDAILYNMLCPAAVNFILNGQYGQSPWTQVQIRVSACTINCLSAATLAATESTTQVKFRTLFLNYQYQDLTFQAYSTNINADNYLLFDSTFFQQQNIYLQYVVTQQKDVTDTNFTQVGLFFTYKQQNEQFVQRTINNQYIEINFRNSKKIEIILKQRGSVVQIMGLIGGVIVIIYLMGMCLVTNYNQHQIERQLTNNVFSYPEVKSARQKIEVKWYHYFCFWSSTFKQHYNLFQISQKEIKNNLLDVSAICHNIQMVQRILALLMDEQQLRVFTQNKKKPLTQDSIVPKKDLDELNNQINHDIVLLLQQLKEDQLNIDVNSNIEQALINLIENNIQERKKFNFDKINIQKLQIDSLNQIQEENDQLSQDNGQVAKNGDDNLKIQHQSLTNKQEDDYQF